MSIIEKRLLFFSWMVLIPSLLLLTNCDQKRSRPAADERPNIVLIMLDDMGYSDLACYGGEIKTPNIDQLAAEGLMFTQFYNAARCCPTRASLLTGLYPHQAGIGHMTVDLGQEGYRGDLNKNSVTIAEVLGKAGYQTMMVGKWHVTKSIETGQPNDNLPLQRGFSRFYGTLPGSGSFWQPFGLMEGNDFVEPQGDFYYTEAIASHAVKYINEASGKDSPFFLYAAFTAPHYPLHARPEAIEKYAGVFSEGWDTLRRKRYERLVASGIVKPQWALPPRDEQSIPWEEEPNKAWQQNRMEVYAAMIDQADQGIGQIISALQEKGELENTLILLFSDNGGSAEGHLFGKIERTGIPWKSKLIPTFTKDSVRVTAGDFPGLNLGPDSTYGSYGVRWANVSNTPFRLHKSWVHEGGIATPFIAHWPKGIKAKMEARHQPAHVIDIMPTCVELAGADYPEELDGSSITPMQGKSLLPIFNDTENRERTLFWEHEGNRAIRKGKWKLVSEYPGSWKTIRPYPKSGAWELYDMEADRTEMNGLSERYPSLVKSLAKEWEEWAEKCNVLPWNTFDKSKDDPI